MRQMVGTDAVDVDYEYPVDANSAHGWRFAPEDSPEMQFMNRAKVGVGMV